MSTRRDFLKTSLTGVVGLAAMEAQSLPLLKSGETRIVILHTNDMHSHIDPFAKDHPLYPDEGGMARRASLIERIRQEEDYVLLFDAGDIWQGTPYFNLFGGKPEFELMSKMKYDAATLGNHDFDNGLTHLGKMLPYAKFPFICSNYDFTSTPLYRKTQPWKVFWKGDLKVGVFGIGIKLKGLVDPTLYGNTRVIDPLEKSKEMSTFLKEDQKCDLVVCLSHLGYQYNSNKVCDVDLAKQSTHIDVIIGGHTHTFLDVPKVFNNKNGDNVVVAQAGWAGLRLGRIDFVFDRKRVKRLALSASTRITKNCAKI